MTTFRDKNKFQVAISSFISNVLIKSEDLARIAEHFKAFDTKNDGKIDKEEFFAAMD